MSRVKAITLSTYNSNYAEDPAAPLYVVNTSDGRLTMNILNDQNRPDTVIIPLSHAPIDITAIVPRANCLTNTTFKKYINRKFLAVVDNKSVEEALKTDAELRAEYERVNNGGAELDLGEIDLGAQGAANQKEKAQLPDNVQQVSNSKLDAILMDCKIAEGMKDKSARTAKIKEIQTVFKRSSNQFSIQDLEQFINVCNTQELSDMAIELLEELNGVEGGDE